MDTTEDLVRRLFGALADGQSRPPPSWSPRTSGGRLAAHRGVRDELGVLWQVGALTPPAPVALDPARRPRDDRPVSVPRPSPPSPGAPGSARRPCTTSSAARRRCSRPSGTWRSPGTTSRYRRPLMRAGPEAGDAAECPRRYAALDRAAPLLGVVFVRAAGRDPAVRAFVDRIEAERGAGTAAVAHHVAARFGLRPGLDEARAADVLWVLTAPEAADRLPRRRGWSVDEYGAWPARSMVEGLLSSGQKPNSTPVARRSSHSLP